MGGPKTQQNPMEENTSGLCLGVFTLPYFISNLKETHNTINLHPYLYPIYNSQPTLRFEASPWNVCPPQTPKSDFDWKNTMFNL